MSPQPVVPITWSTLHPQPEDVPAAACAVCRHPLCGNDVLCCEGCGTTWLHYSCWLQLRSDPAVTAPLAARIEARVADLADRADEDLDRMAELAAEVAVPGRLAALCPGCRS